MYCTKKEKNYVVKKIKGFLYGDFIFKPPHVLFEINALSDCCILTGTFDIEYIKNKSGRWDEKPVISYKKYLEGNISDILLNVNVKYKNGNRDDC